MKQTKKYLAARKTAFEAAVSYSTDIYGALEKAGYRWNAAKGQWERLTVPVNAPKTGLVDIRIRASLGEVEAASQVIQDALEKAGFLFARVSAPDPDDRRGPAMTARVYMNCIMSQRR